MALECLPERSMSTDRPSAGLDHISTSFSFELLPFLLARFECENGLDGLRRLV